MSDLERLFKVEYVGVVISIIALLISAFNFWNARAVRLKNADDALYKLKGETLSKSREIEITYQEIVNTTDYFINKVRKNTSLPEAKKTLIINGIDEVKKGLFTLSLADAKACTNYIIENFDSMDEKKTKEYHLAFISELERLKANGKSLERKLEQLLD
ncbi:MULTISPECIES: hypothetical protein [unclassified Serratia (in: enterobacteria)]|jgi:hypothetical protein|uniref:hypothetical protein n=1 Tax=unclassified Serratia (in: enterobacteria) TaxID=2647522 RepID=UPI002ED5EABF|nr:hypothetical protein [Serratia sp. C2(2)]MEE4446278.1 hypothetical protein [Serratia sp. C2(1)]